MGERHGVHDGEGRTGVLREPADHQRPRASSAASISISRTVPARVTRRCWPHRGRCCRRPHRARSSPMCAPNSLEPAPQLRLTLDRVQAQAMGLPHERCVFGRATDARARVCQRLLFRGASAAGAVAGGRAVSHRARSIRTSTCPPRCRRQVPAAQRQHDVAERHAYRNARICRRWFRSRPWSIQIGSSPRQASRATTAIAAVEITGSNAPGKSSGEAMKEMERIVAEELPRRIRLRLGGPVAAGDPLGGGGAAALRALDPGRVSVPRRTLRELVDAALRDADRAARRPRRVDRGVVAVLAQ